MHHMYMNYIHTNENVSHHQYIHTNSIHICKNMCPTHACTSHKCMHVHLIHACTVIHCIHQLAFIHANDSHACRCVVGPICTHDHASYACMHARASHMHTHTYHKPATISVERSLASSLACSAFPPFTFLSTKSQYSE